MSEKNILFQTAKAGESLAFQEMFQKYKPVVFKMQKKYRLRDLEEEDWLQEGRIVFYLSLQRFEKAKGVTLGSFFRVNFERHTISLLRKQQAFKRQTALKSTSLDQAIEEKGEFFLGLEESAQNLFLQYMIIREKLADFSEGLSVFEVSILRLYLRGKTTTEISEISQCSIYKVNNGLCRIRIKYKKEFIN